MASSAGSYMFYAGVANLTVDLFLWNGTVQPYGIPIPETGAARLTVLPPQDLQNYRNARWTAAGATGAFVFVALPAGLKTLTDLVGDSNLAALRRHLNDALHRPERPK